MNKIKTIEIVNRKYIDPRNVIWALTEKLTHQSTFEGVGVEFGLDIHSSTDFDPAGVNGDLSTSIPAEIHTIDEDTTEDSLVVGMTVEEELTAVDNVYFTSLPSDFFRSVWFDGLLALPGIHWVSSGSSNIIPFGTLISGTQVIAQYVVGFAE